MIQEEGLGWRLARDTSRKKFSILIGAENCAVELSESEWSSLESIVSKLICEYDNMKNQLMAEEEVSLEMERSPWWVCIDGKRDGWSLRLILSGEDSDGRGLEIFWPEPIAEAIYLKMRSMWDCN